MVLNLMIVDDHAGIRELIRNMIATPGDVVRECASGDEALRALSDFQPDCVTMDISMPGQCAFNTTRSIRTACPEAEVIMVSSHDLLDYRRAALEAGANGYVAKENLVQLPSMVETKRLLTSFKRLTR